jgi:hypothetical protein
VVGYLFIMAYKVKKDKEKIFVSALINDGRKNYYGPLGKATQEELKELANIYPQYIEKPKKARTRKKKRDNSPDKPIPTPPNEPETTTNDAEAT